MYVITDWVTTFIAFFLFNICRHYVFSLTNHSLTNLESYLFQPKLICEQAIIPIALLGVYWISGFYNNVIDKSRVHELIVTFFSALFNTILIFFLLLIDDRVPIVSSDYMLVLLSFLCLFCTTYFGRFCITTLQRHHTHKYDIRYNVLIVGNPNQTQKVYDNINKSERSLKYNIVGFVTLSEDSLSSGNYNFRQLKEIKEICAKENVDQIIIAPHNSKDSTVLALLDGLFTLDIPIKIMPDTLSYLTSAIRLTDILGEPFIDLTSSPLSACSYNIKLLFDKIISLLMLILTSPLLIGLMVAIKATSPGNIFYKQERIGLRRKPFNIYKFRSMKMNAEEQGPQLSSLTDNRVTPIGRFMRKYRLDELPQFWNVLKGDMSLVGPRPERDFYIRQIIKKAPYYSLVFQVRPGITSWGMVKFGYASNINQMVERTKFDLLYITNMSISLDIKIIIYTFRTIISGAGM